MNTFYLGYNERKCHRCGRMKKLINTWVRDSDFDVCEDCWSWLYRVELEPAVWERMGYPSVRLER